MEAVLAHISWDCYEDLVQCLMYIPAKPIFAIVVSHMYFLYTSLLTLKISWVHIPLREWPNLNKQHFHAGRKPDPLFGFL